MKGFTIFSELNLYVWYIKVVEVYEKQLSATYSVVVWEHFLG